MYNHEAEIDLIGICVLNPKKVELASGLNSDDFGDRKRWEIYQATQSAVIEGDADVSKVMQHLKQSGSDVVFDDLSWYLENCLGIQKAKYLSEQIKSSTAKRKFMGLFQTAKENINADYKTFFDLMESQILEIKGRLNYGKEMIFLKHALANYLTEMEGIFNGEIVPKVTNTGFYDLDNILGGLKGGNLCILAGRTSMGKTTLGLNIAEYASKNGRVALFSLEMDENEIAEKALSRKAQISSDRMRNYDKIKDITEEEWGRLTDAMSHLGNNTNLIIDPSAKNSILDIASKSMQQHSESELNLIVIDHVGLTDGNGKHESKRLEVSFISRRAKQLAKELNVPVLLLAQLNRGEDGSRPKMSNLKESGSLEEDANQVMLVHRPEYYCDACRANEKCSEGHEGLTEIIIDKNRGGRTGMARLAFIGEHSEFRSLSKY